MQQILLDFQQPNATTWFYLSFLLMIALFFQFSRVLSLRNWDLITLALLAPGMLLAVRVEREWLAQAGAATEAIPAGSSHGADLFWGYVWLFVATAYFFIRSLIDVPLVRRPRLEPNLAIPSLAFLCVCLLGFLGFEVMKRSSSPSGQVSARVVSRIIDGWSQSVDAGPPPAAQEAVAMSYVSATDPQTTPTAPSTANDPSANELGLRKERERLISQVSALFCHALIVSLLILMGWRYFDSAAVGFGMATLYLLLPVTASQVDKIDHLLPTVFLLSALAFHRQPWLSGGLLALASLFVYPLFLIPLWMSFYWGRGARWFALSFAVVSVGLGLAIWKIEPLRLMFENWAGILAWRPDDFHESIRTVGLWTKETTSFRLPIMLVFFVLVILFAFWPREKTLATLIALSLTLILGVQFWHPDRGGSYVLWYLPLLLLMIFRPNLSAFRPALAGRSAPSLPA